MELIIELLLANNRGIKKTVYGELQICFSNIVPRRAITSIHVNQERKTLYGETVCHTFFLMEGQD